MWAAALCCSPCVLQLLWQPCAPLVNAARVEDVRAREQAALLLLVELAEANRTLLVVDLGKGQGSG